MNCETTTTANETTTSGTRETNGRFAKGNRGGPGNPFARQTARLRQALVDAVTPEDMQAIAQGLKKKAAAGDVAATKLLFSYCVGKEDPDTLDQHEMKTIIGNHLDSAVGPLNVLKGMPLDVLVEMFRLILPVLRSEKVKLAKQVLCAPLTEEEIEDSKADAEESTTPETAPSDDPMDNIPQWMQDIGKEPKKPKPGVSPKRQRGTSRAQKPSHQPDRPTPEGGDAEMLRVLLERARHLASASPAQNGHPPSPNGSNGKK